MEPTYVRITFDEKAFERDIYGIISKTEPHFIDDIDLACRTMTYAHSL